MRTNYRWLIAIVILLTGGFATDAQAALPTGVRETLPANDQCLISRYDRYSLYGIAVLTVDDEGATNENPPQGRVDIYHIFRGPGKLGPVDAIWQTFPTATDYLGTEPDAKVKPEWYSLPVKGPTIGERVILCGFYDVSRNILEVVEGHTFHDTPANRKILKKHMASPERLPKYQLFIGGLLVVLPVLNGILLFSARNRKPWLWMNVMIATGTVALYFFYEAGYSARHNIRIDLFLIWPLLVANLGIGVLTGAKLIKRKNSS